MARMQVWPPRNDPLTFLRGMNSFNAPNQLPKDAHVLLKNISLSERGGATKRLGYATYGGTRGTGKDMGIHELIRNDATTYLLRIGDDGLLYKKNGASWTNIPIRLASPYNAAATEAASGAVGANLAATTKYQYAFVAVDATGKTLDSSNVVSDSGEVTTTTPFPVTATCNGVYGAVTYEVWRRTFNVSWGAWGRMTTGLTHTTAASVTSVTYTDDGNTAPDTGQTIPASNTTAYTMSTTQRADWVTARRSGNNAAWFVNGQGIAWTDGTTANLVQPATLTPAGGAIPNNALWDVTHAIYTCRAIHSHHTYGFLCNATSQPQRFYFSDVEENFEWFPTAALINDPYTQGGRVLDFRTKDDALVVGTTMGIDILWGRVFDTTNLGDGTIYFSHASDFGVASEWSMTKGPEGSILYLDRNKRLRELIAISPVKEQVVERELPGGEAIRPTLTGMTDEANATAFYDGDQYAIAFPADLQVVRVYFFDSGRGRIDAPVLDAMADGIAGWLRLDDGTLIASDNDSGQLYEMYKSETFTDNGTAITMSHQSASISGGDDLNPKEHEALYLILGVGDGYSLDVNVYTNQSQAPSKTVTTSVGGSDGYAATEASATGATYDESTYSRITTSIVEVELGGVFGHAVTVELSNDSATEQPIIYGMYIEFMPEDRPTGERD